MLSGTRANIAVKIFGPDLYSCACWPNRPGRRCRGARGGGPVRRATDRGSGAEGPLRPRRHRPPRLTIREVARTLEAALQGVKVSRVLEGQSSYDLVVRLAGRRKVGGSKYRDLLVDTPPAPGATGPGGASARRPARITSSREQVERKIVVQCNVVRARRDRASCATSSRLVDPLLVAERAITGWSMAGQFESAAEAGRTLRLWAWGGHRHRLPAAPGVPAPHGMPR
jgi:Cu/Ag efflux pump CusA